MASKMNREENEKEDEPVVGGHEPVTGGHNPAVQDVVVSEGRSRSLHRIKVSLLQQQVKLLIIDSMAALVLGEYDCGASRQQPLGWHVSFIKSLAEFSRIPIVLTNQVRSQIGDESLLYSFQAQSHSIKKDNSTTYDSHLVAALGINWAHAVTIRLVLEAKSGQRFIKLAKSPISPPLAFPFNITSSGIILLDDDGIEIKGPEINTIHCQGQNALFNVESVGHQ